MTPPSEFEPLPDADPLAPLVDDFLSRAQAGECPTIDEYCEAHPELADEIRHLFPALLVMQDFGPDDLEQETNLPPVDLPERIGGYRIVAEIGRGGMGVVYEAEQESLGRRVALKVLPGQRSIDGSQNSALRFKQEARAAAQMHHTNIVPVFEVGEDDGRFFYAMQLIPGQSLDLVIEELRKPDQQLSGGRLGQPLSDAGAVSSGVSGSSVFREGTNSSAGSKRRQFYRSVAKIGVQVASALEFAHGKGVIHRDVKPGNLLLDAHGTIWVTDFGLAKIEDSGLTQTGDFLGTLRYMAPERFRGQCDVRADIYALGVTLYELLLQRPAFAASDRLTLVQQINDETPARPRTIDRHVPRDLETILIKAIGKDVKHRYRSARAMGQDLQRFLDDEPILARRPSLWDQTIRWTRRNRALATAVGGIFVLMSALLVGSMWATARQAKLRQDAEHSNARSEHNLYVAQMNLAGQALGQAAGAFELKEITDAWLPSDNANDRRDWEWYYLRSHCQNNVLTLKTPQRCGPIDAVWSPDQTRVATAQSDGRIYLWDAATGQLQGKLERHPNDVVALSWNPKLPLLAACDDDNNIWVWDLPSGKPVQKFKAPAHTLLEQVAWDPAGQRLAWSSNSFVYVWNSDQGSVEPVTLAGGPEIITSLQWSPDGHCIAASSWRQQLTSIWDVSRRELIRSDLKATLVDWGLTGHQLQRWLLATPLGEIMLFRSEVDGPIMRFTGHTSMARFLSWAPGRDRFVSAADDHTIRVWNADSGASDCVFAEHTKAALTARFSSDGSRLVSTSRDGLAKVWAVESPQKRTLQRPASLDSSKSLQDRPVTGALSWHPDGNRIAVVSVDGVLRVRDAASGELLFTDRERWLESACFSPDGQWLVGDEMESAALEYYPGDAYMIDQPGKAFVFPATVNARALPIAVSHAMRCNGAAWAPTGQRFATIANDKKLRLWRIEASTDDSKKSTTLERQLDLGGHAAEQIAWNPIHGQVIATSNYHGTIDVWSGNERLWQLTGHRGRIHSIAWSQDGNYLASAGQDATVRVWDLATGQQVSLLKGHHNAVRSVRWRLGDSRLATGGADGTIKIWDPVSGNELLTLRGHRSAVLAVVWSPDGSQLASLDVAGEVVIWDARAAYQ